MFNGVRHLQKQYIKQPSSDSFEHIKMPYEQNSGLKVLFVLDHIPTEDMKSGRLLSGDTGAMLKVLIQKAQVRSGVKQFSWLCCSYNAYRTYGKGKAFIDAAHQEFTQRLHKIIKDYKPDLIIPFGFRPSNALIPDQVEKTEGYASPWFGVPIKTDMGIVCPSVTLRSVAQGSTADTGMLGYMISCIASGLRGKLKYAIDNQIVKNHQTVLVDTMDKFLKLMAYLKSYPGRVAADTETDNLNRIVNKLLTVQFATTAKRGYVIPIDHKDTPFSGQELKRIKRVLRDYFEDNENEYHVYVNASFDLNIYRSQLGIRFYKAAVWDVFAGEFSHDENMKFLTTLELGKYYYSLGNLTVQYGCEAYLDSPFSKEHRHTISKVDLDENVLKYMTLDVVVPLQIVDLQQQRARDNKHEKYNSMVVEQLSDTLHSFSIMESTGSLVDIDYLFFLRSAGSPIEAKIRELEAQMLKAEGCIKANRILARGKGATGGGLFGDELEEQVFLNLSKEEHKSLLFFDVLKLEPVNEGESGKGKLDKHFQQAYAHVPEVAMFTTISKAKKLRNAYVKSFLKKLRESADFRFDKHIRSRYHYLKVITGRASSEDPNLQQIPSRDELGKTIKRLFIAPDGHLYVKVDYRVHEVRGLGLISFDKAIAELFEQAKKIRDLFRVTGDPAVKTRLKTEADIHIMNACFFFVKTFAEVMALKLRNPVKSVVFGLIYQMSMKSLAELIKQPLDFTKELVAKFQKRFPRGMKWIEETKVKAQQQLYIENPFGFRRHLWGFLYPETVACSKRVIAEMARKAVNSPIQGMCAQMMFMGIRLLDQAMNEQRVAGRNVDYQICNTVHDSLECTFSYKDILLGIREMEDCLVRRVRETTKARHGFEFNVDLEIDFCVGPALSEDHEWSFGLVDLERILFQSLEFQRDELKREIDIDECMQQVFRNFDQDAPTWLKKQRKALDWKLMSYAKYQRLLAREEREAQLAAETKAAEEKAAAKTVKNKPVITQRRKEAA